MKKFEIKNCSRALSELSPGPIALIRDDDGVNLQDTIDHHRAVGFPNIVVLSSEVASEVRGTLMIITPNEMSLNGAINILMDDVSGRWVFAAHNAEYFYFPFSHTRSVMDLVQFVDEERRNSVFCSTVDLYPSTIVRGAEAFSPDDAWFDKSGYYSSDRFEGPDKLERQIDVFGGLRWRYAEHIPWERQRINRTALFKAATNLRVDDDGIFSETEYNTLACPWHNNLTAAVASFRVAKSLIQNPGSTFEIENLIWEQSAQFDWTPQQLMEHGLIEPGQWF